ncbi:MAG: YifB family Mg chelatase-like AAA ATPase [Methyloversatilis sp.]|jgi:magnesium chelatase family protein|uniref:YifB family Mg chelatase-like AAA ATPase n=1 Tax=Methyloversatilis sp. TaxID=2569862 RepID=UPI0025EC1C4C|nr:YifB family Mg chelatase-like AAA ATPase [Methyloversatilis sp.]MCR6664613.1 YifB family Mg chelatase-like AAA ATPase [Methyloversatilis sp.]
MSLAILRSRALAGMQAPEVAVEVHVSNGLPAFSLVGLPDVEVREARDRVRAAILSSGFDFPARRITVNLAPADLPKESGRFDLPIALGILIAAGSLEATDIDGIEFAGELSLTGALRPVRGALPMALGARAAGRTFVLPASSAPEAVIAGGIDVRAATSLLDVCAHLCGQSALPRAVPASITERVACADLADVRGQRGARRALEIAAAGNHSLLMSGPPGTGKSMLAARFTGLLPDMDEAEALDTAAVLSGAGLFDPAALGRRPFRAPHHSASAAALVGGGAIPRPGEISLAHNGVLFLDELPEFDRRVLEALREPLETGHVTISRAAHRAEFPARFQLIAAMNPCPCGYLGHPSARCRCTPDQIARYRGRLSGPLLDRIDLTVVVPPLTEHELRAGPGEASVEVRQRVCAARALQQRRQGKPNQRLEAADIDRHCPLDDAAHALLAQAMNRLRLSARAYHRCLKVARTIADLNGREVIAANEVAEAVQFRRALDSPAS